MNAQNRWFLGQTILSFLFFLNNIETVFSATHEAHVEVSIDHDHSVKKIVETCNGFKEWYSSLSQEAKDYLRTSGTTDRLIHYLKQEKKHWATTILKLMGPAAGLYIAYEIMHDQKRTTGSLNAQKVTAALICILASLGVNSVGSTIKEYGAVGYEYIATKLPSVHAKMDIK